MLDEDQDQDEDQDADLLCVPGPLLEQGLEVDLALVHGDLCLL